MHCLTCVNCLLLVAFKTVCILRCRSLGSSDMVPVSSSAHTRWPFPVQWINNLDGSWSCCVRLIIVQQALQQRKSKSVHTQCASPLSRPLQCQGLTEHRETREKAKQAGCWQGAVTCGRERHRRSDLGFPGSWGDLEIQGGCVVLKLSQDTCGGCHKSDLFIHPACQVPASTETFFPPRLLHRSFTDHSHRPGPLPALIAQPCFQ